MIKKINKRYLYIFILFVFAVSWCSANRSKSFINDIAYSAWNGLYRMMDKNTNLPYDIVEAKTLKVVDSKTSPTEIGLFLSSIICARDLEFIDSFTCNKILNNILDSLLLIKKKRGTNQGFYVWFYNAKKLERINSFISSVDNGNLCAGLIIVHSAVDNVEIKEKIENILLNMDFNVFFNQENGLLNHGFDFETYQKSPYDYGVINTEARLTSLISILKDDVPNSVWYNMRQHIIKYFKTKDGKYIPVIASWGGSAFECLFADLFFNEEKYSPEGFGLNNKRYAKIHLIEEPRILNINFGGWSPGQDIDGIYKECGISELGEKGYPVSFITPYSILLCLRYYPDTGINILKNIISLNKDVFIKDIGFVDSIDTSGKISQNIISLDKAIEFIALYNYIRSTERLPMIDKYFWDYWAGIGKLEYGHKLLNQKFDTKFYKINFKDTSPIVEKTPMYLLKDSIKNIGSFYTPGNSFCQETFINNNIIQINYELIQKESFCGLYVQYSHILNLSEYKNFLINIKAEGVNITGLNIEFKFKNGIKKIFSLTNITEHWQKFNFILPYKIEEIDEFVVVIKNSATLNRRGSIFIDILETKVY